MKQSDRGGEAGLGGHLPSGLMHKTKPGGGYNHPSCVFAFISFVIGVSINMRHLQRQNRQTLFISHFLVEILPCISGKSISLHRF
jgi:hypothetical protein